jgi:hypothetical protein
MAPARRGLAFFRRPADTEWSTGRRKPEPVVPGIPVAIQPDQVHRVENFPDAGPLPWLDRPDARDRIDQLERSRRVTSREAQLCRKWADDGYIVVPGLIDHDRLDRVWRAYEKAIADRLIQPPPEPHFDGDRVPGRVLNPHVTLPEIEELMHHPMLVHIVELLLGTGAIPYQSISGHKASQQPVHSDSIHMTTYPQGYLVAMWIAFEDIDPGAGPLVYYPGSHRFPCIYSKDVGIEVPPDRQPDYGAFERLYTPVVYRIIAERQLTPQYFHARKGDVLFWHANILHGGSERRNFAATRRALVFHYFGTGCVCYHDLAGAPAWFPTKPAARSLA